MHGRVERHRDHRKLGGRIQMAETSADGAAIARLPVADEGQRLAHEGTTFANQTATLELALAGHGADPDAAVHFVYERQIRNTVQIDDVIRKHEAHVQHGDQGLTARQHLRILEARQQLAGFADLARLVVLKWRRLHRSTFIAMVRDLPRDAPPPSRRRSTRPDSRRRCTDARTRRRAPRLRTAAGSGRRTRP